MPFYVRSPRKSLLILAVPKRRKRPIFNLDQKCARFPCENANLPHCTYFTPFQGGGLSADPKDPAVLKTPRDSELLSGKKKAHKHKLLVRLVLGRPRNVPGKNLGNVPGKNPLNSRSPKAGHPKAGRSDFRNQRFETDTGKMRKVPLTPEKQGSGEIPQSKNAENAENAGTKTRKMRKMRMTGFNVTGFR